MAAADGGGTATAEGDGRGRPAMAAVHGDNTVEGEM